MNYKLTYKIGLHTDIVLKEGTHKFCYEQLEWYVSDRLFNRSKLTVSLHEL